jgi:hypothetical protein
MAHHHGGVFSLSLSLSLSLSQPQTRWLIIVSCGRKEGSLSCCSSSLFPIRWLECDIALRTPLWGLPTLLFHANHRPSSCNMCSHVWTKWVEIEWSCPSNQSFFGCDIFYFFYIIYLFIFLFKSVALPLNI